MKPLRAVTYARVSTQKPTQDTSLRRQGAELRDAAERHRWKVIEQISDRLSGGRNDREGFRAAVDLVVRGRADVLVVHDLDRLGRDVREMLYTLDAIDAAGGHLLVLSLNIDTSTPAGRMAFTMSGALAEHQRRDNTRKVIAGLEYARKKGVRLGRPPTLTPAAVARAVKLRRQRPRPSWRLIAIALRKERLGRYPDSTVAGAVARELERTKRESSRSLERTKHGPRKTPTKTPRKIPQKQRGSRRSRSAAKRR